MWNPLESLSRWAVKRAAKYAGVPLRDPALVAMLGQMPATSGVDVTEYTAMNCSAVWAAVNIISSSTASLPKVLKDGKFHIQEKHRVHRALNRSPNSDMIPFNFTETLQGHALTWGNGYAEIEREDDFLALWPITPNRVTEQRADNGELVYLVQPDDGESGPSEVIPARDMLHISGLGFDGVRGYSVIQLARESIGLAIATERFGASYFGRGALPGGIISHPGDLSKKSRKNLRETWELLHRGPDNAHRVAILDEGMKWQQIGLPPEDSQFLQTRQFGVLEIARWFNVPPHMLRDLSAATFSNIENQGIDFLTYTLRPWLVKWAQECHRKLLTPEEQETYHVDHLVNELLRTDTDSRYRAYGSGLDHGHLTVNDVLRAERMPEIGAVGDKRIVPANMDILGEPRRAMPVPLDPAAMDAAINLLKNLTPVTWDLAHEMLAAVQPGVSETFLDAMCAKLRSLHVIVGDLPDKAAA